MHTDGWRLVELEDGSSSSSDLEEVLMKWTRPYADRMTASVPKRVLFLESP
jgi:hypothetical protein